MTAASKHQTVSTAFDLRPWAAANKPKALNDGSRVSKPAADYISILSRTNWVSAGKARAKHARITKEWMAGISSR
jgi:hypothetical protein